MEEVLEIVYRRRGLGGVNHNLIRRIILRDIFQNPLNHGMLPRPVFDLELIEPKEAKLNFRFAKEDIPRLVTALHIPAQIRTRSGHIASGVEAVCMFLRRLTYPNRLYDLEHFFQRSSAALSEICNFINMYIYRNYRHLLEDIGNLNWIHQNRLQLYAEAITAKGAAVHNCWGFIDGTARAICRPSQNQEEYYSGHKRHHCVKYQSVVCPDGITAPPPAGEDCQCCHI